MAITEQERRRRAAAAEKARQERERLRLEDKKRSDDIEAKRLDVQQREQDRLTAEQRQREIDAQRQREKEDAENSVGGQAYQIAKTLAAPAVGFTYGAKKANEIEARQAAMSPAQQARMGTARRIAPYLARGLLFGPEGYYLREHVAPQIENETGRELVHAGGTGMMLAGGVLAGEGVVKGLTPPKIAGVNDAVPVPPPPAAPPQLPPPAANPGPATPTRPHGERLVSAARAAGATGPLNKQSAADFLAANVSDANRSAVAEALGVKPGPNFAKRIGSTLKTMASTRGASVLAGPVAAGALAAAMGPGEAQAADGTQTGDSLGNAATRAGTAAGAAYGVQKAMNYVGPLARGILGSAGTAMTPMMAADAYSPEPDTLAMDRNTMARKLPAFLRGGAVEDAYQMAQLPERNPERGQEMPYYDAPQMPPEAAPEPPIDWDAAIAAKGPMLDRISQDQMRQIATALASQGVAGRGDAFPAQQPQDEQTRRLAEALMGAY